MPCGDGTGPMGMGPMTGRGAGFCGGFGAPGFMNAAPGRGGMGFGRGRGRGAYACGWCRAGEGGAGDEVTGQRVLQDDGRRGQSAPLANPQ